MRVEEAIEKFAGRDTVKSYDLARLYHNEVYSRLKLRAHGKATASESMLEGILVEMDGWIVKVCRGLGLSEDATEKTRQENKEVALSAMRKAIMKKSSTP